MRVQIPAEDEYGIRPPVLDDPGEGGIADTLEMMRAGLRGYVRHEFGFVALEKRNIPGDGPLEAGVRDTLGGGLRPGKKHFRPHSCGARQLPEHGRVILDGVCVETIARRTGALGARAAPTTVGHNASGSLHCHYSGAAARAPAI